MSPADVLHGADTSLFVAPVDDDYDDDLVHSVCDYCDRALCDGGICYGEVEYDDSDLDCLVCVDLEPRFGGACPYCHNGGGNE